MFDRMSVPTLIICGGTDDWNQPKRTLLEATLDPWLPGRRSALARGRLGACIAGPRTGKGQAVEHVRPLGAGRASDLRVPRPNFGSRQAVWRCRSILSSRAGLLAGPFSNRGHHHRLTSGSRTRSSTGPIAGARWRSLGTLSVHVLRGPYGGGVLTRFLTGIVTSCAAVVGVPGFATADPAPAPGPRRS
jgi:hypothetical protein